MADQKQGSQMRITDEENKLIRATFKNNEQLLKLMRKMFLPELDPNAPIGQLVDLWLTIPTKDRTPEQIAIDLMARNMLIAHVDNVLMQMNLLSKQEDLTPSEIVEKVKKDSSK